MKKYLICISIMLVFLCVVPSTVSASENVSTDTDGMINVDYVDFHSNKAYYDELIKQGNTICVYVGEEYADAEIERITNSASPIHELNESQARGKNVPTETYNIHENVPYPFSTDARFEILYTDVKIYGCTAYLMDGYNDTNQDVTIYLYNTAAGGRIDFTVPALSTIYKPFGTNTSQDCFFAAFLPPSNTYGTINCIAH